MIDIVLKRFEKPDETSGMTLKDACLASVLRALFTMSAFELRRTRRGL
jgi:hypothetical protein